MAFASFLVQQPKVWMKVESWYFRLQKYMKSPTVLIMLPVPSMAKFTCPLWMDCLLNVSLKKLFCFSFEFSENWQNCSYICVLKLHKVSLNWMKNKKVFLMINSTDSPSVKGRWIRPWAITYQEIKITCEKKGQPSCKVI